MKLLLLTSIVVYSAETQYAACVSNVGASVLLRPPRRNVDACGPQRKNSTVPSIGYTRASPNYPFLRGASWSAVNAFNEIIGKYNITKEDRDEALDKWAVDNDLLDVYRNYRSTAESAREERQKAILSTLDYLREFFERVGELQANKSYTCNQESDGIRELCSTLNHLERRLVDSLMYAYRTGSSEKVKKALRLVSTGN